MQKTFGPDFWRYLHQIKNKEQKIIGENTTCLFRIHRMHLCREVTPFTKECPGYDTKQSDGEVPVLLEQNTEYLFIAIAHRSTLTRSGST